jgi:transcriptional regulator with XRE-family HTH domain
VIKNQERGATMREKERMFALKRLDKEMRFYRWAGKEKNPTSGLLRAVRQALHIPAAEIAKKMKMNRSGVFDYEARELRNSITLKSMSRMAEAMGCKMVYGIVPEGGKTLEELEEKRLWAEVLTERAASQQVSESASRQVSEAAGGA